MELSALYLKRNEERRLRAGHLWVYSNEVDNERSPLAGFTPGQPVAILSNLGKPLGTGYVNPHTLICARLVSRDPDFSLNRSLLVHRLNVALALRERLYPDSGCYRLLHGEADGVPGLIVDRFGDVLVVQLNTAGMDAAKEEVVAALDKTLEPRAILLRNDSSAREMEGLPRQVEALGAVPDDVVVKENGASFQVPLKTGQKTGWYFDHRENRARLQRYAAGAQILDLFSYIGAWGIEAATAGAKAVTLVEGSPSALERAAENAAMNGIAGRTTTIHSDVFTALKELRAENRHFDIVVADPPAFIKKRKDIRPGLEAYQRLARMAMQVLTRDGILVNASCSFHLSREQLRELLLQSARHLDRSMQILEQGHQAPDHPVHPAIPETDYIKCFFARVLPA
jgi:23S rRNA (cytosine1962-C5)-methyltransferase